METGPNISNQNLCAFHNSDWLLSSIEGMLVVETSKVSSKKVDELCSRSGGFRNHVLESTVIFLYSMLVADLAGLNLYLDVVVSHLVQNSATFS